MGLRTASLPDFPWDTLAAVRARAAEHPGGLVDLSVGTPVDPTPALVREALAAAADSPGYPTTHGTPELREAVVAWFARSRGVPGLDPAAVLPTVGSKELVATLPSWLGLGPGDAVVFPEPAYPTYDVGAVLAGAEGVPASDGGLEALRERDDVRLVWLNSPGNPDGTVLGVERLAQVVSAARERGALVVSDECYAELPWVEPWLSEGVPSVLDPRVTGGDPTGVLAVHSLSKRSNLAGYRAGFVAGDPAVVAALLEARKHAGMMVPGPVQAAMVAALEDDEHVREQRERYGVRRELLKEAFEGAGYVVDGSEAGLYLWVRPEGEQDSLATLADLAELGILVAPGSFYTRGEESHVRVALTAPDTKVREAAQRLLGA